MKTYEQDLGIAQLALKRWLRKAALARTKLRRIKARLKRLKKTRRCRSFQACAATAARAHFPIHFPFFPEI